MFVYLRATQLGEQGLPSTSRFCSHAGGQAQRGIYYSYYHYHCDYCDYHIKQDYCDCDHNYDYHDDDCYNKLVVGLQ